jgi:hypothetical protein
MPRYALGHEDTKHEEEGLFEKGFSSSRLRVFVVAFRVFVVAFC